MIPLKDNIKTARFPLVTVLLIVVNVGFFVWQLTYSGSSSSSPELDRLGVSERDENAVQYGAIPYRILHPGEDCAFGVTGSSDSDEADVVCEDTSEYTEAQDSGEPLVSYDNPPWLLTVFSSMFMHGGILHIAFNMLFLWIFGNNVEDALGRLGFLAFYLVSGLVAVYAFAVADSGGTGPLIGASGAIAGVMGAYAALYPKARVLTVLLIIFFVTLLEIPALVWMAVWVGLQLVSQLSATSLFGGTEIAYLAHLGGAVFGFLLLKLMTRGGVVAPAPTYSP